MIHLFTMTSSSEKETKEIASRLTQEVFRPGIPILLSGQLGAGKTYFVKGIAQSLGIPDHIVVSPSFALINEYYGSSFTLNHMDFYRLESWKEVEELGLEEYISSHSFTVIEWGDRFMSFFSSSFFVVKLTDTGLRNRRIEVFYQENEKGKEINDYSCF